MVIFYFVDLVKREGNTINFFNLTIFIKMEIKINVPDGRKGKWQIKTFQLTEEQATLHNLEEVMNGTNRFIPANVEYKSLLRFEGRYLKTGYPVMSNTPAEVKDHLPFIKKATGDVLIFGLGLGMVVQALIEKDDVKSITVIELDNDVIELSGNYYTSVSEKVKIIHGDAFEYRDSNIYNAIWFDIWNAIEEGNLQEMKLLKSRWKNQSPIRMCWAEKECRKWQDNLTSFQ